ncbi:hypothetical protein [Halalkalicoccus salilacus]|uniref:hypothetical protein n=1 Tax=Halalkalicoccus sp. GCM10025704 TaxID=3252662 RepID=UPI003614024C
MLEAIRRSEHTGENRCWPCTVMNVGLVACAAAVVAVVSPFLALLLVIGGGGMIALRGYVVPYTPRFAPRLVERLPWDPFHAAEIGPAEPDSLSTEDVDPEALLDALIEAGVIEAEGERVALERGFTSGGARRCGRSAISLTGSSRRPHATPPRPRTPPRRSRDANERTSCSRTERAIRWRSPGSPVPSRSRRRRRCERSRGPRSPEGGDARRRAASDVPRGVSRLRCSGSRDERIDVLWRRTDGEPPAPRRARV